MCIFFSYLSVMNAIVYIFQYSSQMNSIGDDVPYQFSDENLAQTSPCDNEGDVEKTASNGKCHT